MEFQTADLCDRFAAELQIGEPLFRDYGGKPRFAGQIATIKCFEDNSRVRDLVAEAGRGRVLVIDAGGSMRRAVLGDMLELGPRGVRVNAIAPGLIQTKLSEYYWKDDARRTSQIERQPVRHLGQPGEIAEAALLLAGDGASYMTGQTITIDGGYLLSSM